MERKVPSFWRKEAALVLFINSSNPVQNYYWELDMERWERTALWWGRTLSMQIIADYQRIKGAPAPNITGMTVRIIN